MIRTVVGLASEPGLLEYRSALRELLERSGATIIDLNAAETWSTVDQLIDNCVTAVHTGDVDFVVLVSRSGNGLLMMANKHSGVRAAAALSIDYAREAGAELQAQMCEVSSEVHDPTTAAAFVEAFAEARSRFLDRSNGDRSTY